MPHPPSRRSYIRTSTEELRRPLDRPFNLAKTAADAKQTITGDRTHEATESI